MSCETQLRLCGDGIGSLSHFTFLGISVEFVEFASLAGLRMTKTGRFLFSLAFFVSLLPCPFHQPRDLRFHESKKFLDL